MQLGCGKGRMSTPTVCRRKNGEIPVNVKDDTCLLEVSCKLAKIKHEVGDAFSVDHIFPSPDDVHGLLDRNHESPGALHSDLVQLPLFVIREAPANDSD